MGEFEKMKVCMDMDKIKPESLETFFEVGFKLEINPLPLFRKWLERNGISAEVHFYYKSHDTIKEKINKLNKKKNIITVIADKGERGIVEEVKIINHFI